VSVELQIRNNDPVNATRRSCPADLRSRRRRTLSGVVAGQERHNAASSVEDVDSMREPEQIAFDMSNSAALIAIVANRPECFRQHHQAVIWFLVGVRMGLLTFCFPFRSRLVIKGGKS